MENSSHMNYSDASQGAAGGPLKIDISNLQRPNNIRNDKELEGEINRVCEVLKDTCKLYRILTLLNYRDS